MSATAHATSAALQVEHFTARLTGVATHLPAAHAPGLPLAVQGPGKGVQAPPGPQASHWLSH